MMNDLLRTLGQTLSSRASIESVFGTPIVVGRRTYVPVARVQFGYGGGEQEGGCGAGGGLEAIPLGLFELTEEGATFVPLSEEHGLAGESRLREAAPGIFPLARHSWLLEHQGRFALIHPPAPGPWLQHLTGPVDVIVARRKASLFPQARHVDPCAGLWKGHLGGEPLFVLPADKGVVFRGVLLLPEGQKGHRPGLPGGYHVHTHLPDRDEG